MAHTPPSSSSGGSHTHSHGSDDGPPFSPASVKESHDDDPRRSVGGMSVPSQHAIHGNLEMSLLERFSAAIEVADEAGAEAAYDYPWEWEEEAVLEPQRSPEGRFTWDELDNIRRTHSDASHNLYSPQNSRTLLALRQKSYVTVFESLGLHSILEELDLQLEVLGHAFPGQFVLSDEFDFLSYDERFSRETKERELFRLPTLKNFKDPFKVDQSQLGTPEERLARKLQKDRAFLQEIVSVTKEEMLLDRSFEKLKDHIRREDNRRNEEATLLDRMDKASLAVKKLKHRMTEYERQMSRHEQNRKEMIRELRDQLHGEKIKGRADARYTRAFLQAHNRFHYEQLRHEADIAKLRLKDVEFTMTRDRMVHKNLEAWTLLRNEETSMVIQSWKDKFEDDIAEIEKRIRDKQDQLRIQLHQIQDLTENIDERRLEMEPWEEIKEQERLAKIEYLRLYYSARKIQRWWRAYMLKHKLYKKKPRRKKAKALKQGEEAGKGAGGGKKGKAGKEKGAAKGKGKPKPASKTKGKKKK